MSLYTDTDEHKARVVELEGEALDDLLRALSYTFGSAGVRGMTSAEVSELRHILRMHANRVTSQVEGFYIREATKASEQATLNMVRGILAGSAATARDLTGQEPEPWVKDFVEGEEPLVKRDGESFYMKALAQEEG